MKDRPKIYTRTGDEGQTSLFAGGRIDKDSPRLHAYGTVDELNSMLGLAIAQGVAPELAAKLNRVQNELFVVGSDLATPLEAEAQWIVRVRADQTDRLEHEIDAMTERLPPLKNFILPGGTPGAAALHVARTICRRVERWIVAASRQESLNPQVLRYINRLSDWLFVAARLENNLAGREDATWQSPDRR